MRLVPGFWYDHIPVIFLLFYIKCQQANAHPLEINRRQVVCINIRFDLPAEFFRVDYLLLRINFRQ